MGSSVIFPVLIHIYPCTFLILYFQKASDNKKGNDRFDKLIKLFFNDIWIKVSVMTIDPPL